MKIDDKTISVVCAETLEAIKPVADAYGASLLASANGDLATHSVQPTGVHL